ncbi:bifunctional phosphopantothenoylcysteine decarboxylase/phosphopantothenate--cysteine ligase CoaBC [Hyphomicrobium methylovorum]|uniref:bifunctional phosphopantothenoylcysteine decarboxylase/phosphopantothenate--cysteine ligase CoaBC n=1 Tax=Hyphomicrobium methylovorum TaxID=84 RepID=UPI0015E632E4|nr:bifunctional phosphopantothenoylcysteine decarboxylase/phosphopantothenate--cysteine ligase CoaBC [Hyphomicrobium methylovorum]MBA2126403.1 bifunctional phosphopantothenoylcysteine decarboxylase/phosphopantothenate--cysteine ligase CoaBC [Hyphomicrobium methylovorum]
MSSPKRILLIVSGGIAAYKALELVRRLQDRRYRVRVVMTKAATEFVTPLSFSALTNDRVFTDLFDLDDEREIGHIRLARDHDAIVIAPATADLIAKMAGGHANDLATAILLATDKPVLVAPAMNPHMWQHQATRRNVEQLKRDGVRFIGPAEGEMAEKGEAGPGRLVEVPELVAAIESLLSTASPIEPQSLAGRHVIVTSGPTHEQIDPVRYLANRSSGKQGYELATAAARLGARVTLVSGPVTLADPAGVTVVRVTEAAEMQRAVEAALPADIAIFAAAVADWRIASPSTAKIKKNADAAPPTLVLAENADILKEIAHRKTKRPALVIGFAAETNDVLEHAKRKLKTKGADWIVANDVSPQTGIMGGDRNTVHLLTGAGIESWPDMSKADVARQLIAMAAKHLAAKRAAAE